jgi:hypothetical protein
MTDPASVPEMERCERHPGWVLVWCNACVHESATASEARIAALTAALAKHHRAEGYDKAPLLDPRCVICGVDTARAGP